MDISSLMQRFSYSLPDLYSQVSQNGWEVKKIKYDSGKDRFEAVAKNHHGEEMSAWGPNEKLAVANLVHLVVARNGMRMGKVSMWSHTFTSDLPAIAEAFSKAPLYEPKAAVAFMELGRDSEHRAKALQDHLEITIVNEPEPYSSPEKMFDDIRKRRKLEVSRAGIDHPLWSPNQVIAYRIVHDVLGHCASGGGFDWEGENRAFAAHAAILPVEAQKALFTESIAVAAYATYYRSYGPHKIALFPEFMDGAQEKENPHGAFRGIHPSQSRPALPEPHVKPILSHLEADARIERKTAQGAAGGLTDPNAGWQSGVAPLPQNAMLDHGDPLGAMPPANSQTATEGPLFENARLIDTEWAMMNQEDPADLEQMKRAIVNAFRVVLLSPQKDLRWNAVHYQDISHIPGNEDDPTKYWHTLENARQEWNVKRYGEDARYKHMPYYKAWKDVEQLLYQRNPQAGWQTAIEKADRLVFRTRTRIENQLRAKYNAMSQSSGESSKTKRNRNATPDEFKIELEAGKELQRALEFWAKEHQMGFDFQAKAPPVHREQENLFDIPQEPLPDMARYGAFMGSHLQAIAQISQHVDEILKAALEDVKTGGAGWHFRSTVLNLGVRGVGPKVCSFAWLLLQPMTSQLATIDTHMMDVLGVREKDMNPRDYFKFERMLQTGRDASGYNHVPLGLFQWGMWDAKRTGVGTHQDHSAMRVLDPQSHESVDWAAKMQGDKGENWQPFDWWQATEPARNAVATDWDQTVAPNVPRTQIPYNNGAPPAVYSKLAASKLVPWFTHPQTGERIVGQPGQTIANHLTGTLGMDLATMWNLDDQNVGKSM